MRNITDNYRAVRADIDRAAIAAGRDPQEVLLLAVSKTMPAEDIRELYEAGVRDFGENRIQELELFWKHRRKMAGLSVSDVILDQTSNNIICIKCAYEEGNEAELRRYCLLLTDSASCIGRNEKISIDNIF